MIGKESASTRFWGTFFCFMMLTVSANAEVFTLWPFSKGEKGGEELSGALQPVELWTEPVIINGVSVGMKIGLLENDLRTSFGLLHKLYPKAVKTWNANSLLMEIQKKDGKKERLYLVELGGIYPVIQFSIQLPEKIPSSFSWPSELPLPAGAEPLSCIQFPKRKSSYGHFLSSFVLEQSLTMLRNELEADGWKAVTKESASGGLSGKGEMFMKTSPLSIMIVSFSESEDGTVKGSVYTRSIK